MSVHFGGILMAVGAVTGLAAAELLGVGTLGAWILAASGAVRLTAVSMKASSGSLAWGFGARHGPGPSPRVPEWIDEEKGVGIFEVEDGWRAVHFESGLEATGATPQDVDDELTADLKEHGWYDD